MLKKDGQQQLDAFVPFLVKRGKDSVQRRVDKVRDLTGISDGKITFDSAIETYCREKGIFDLKSEFPVRGQQFLNLRKVKEINISSAELQQILKGIIEMLKNGLALDTRKDTVVSFILFANAAAALSDSSFFASLKTNSLPTVKSWIGSYLFPKFKRNLDKMRSYLRIPELIDFIRGFRSVDITWVPKLIASPKHVARMKDIVIPSVSDIALELARENMKNHPIVQSLTIEDLDEKFSKQQKGLWQKGLWEGSYTREVSITPRLHAEIQIVLHLAGKDETNRQFIPVGCSKRSCLQCDLLMERLADGRWRTAGAHAWPYHTAALIDNEQCDDRVFRIIKGYAIDEVQRLLRIKPARPTHAYKNSEEYVTASSGSEDELKPVVGKESLKLQGIVKDRDSKVDRR